MLSDEKSALKKVQDLSDRLDKARESQREAAAEVAELTKAQRAAAKQVDAANKTTVRRSSSKKKR